MLLLEITGVLADWVITFTSNIDCRIWNNCIILYIKSSNFLKITIILIIISNELSYNCHFLIAINLEITSLTKKFGFT